MTEEEMLAIVKSSTGESDDKVVSAYLALAGDIVLRHVYPFKTDLKDLPVPTAYLSHQTRIACYLLNKRGAEGEISHTEGGINRQYENGDIPPSLLNGIVPCAEVLS